MGRFLFLLAYLAVWSLQAGEPTPRRIVGVCKGADPCVVCRDCSQCRFCDPKNAQGGSCGVVRSQREAERAKAAAKREAGRR